MQRTMRAALMAAVLVGASLPAYAQTFAQTPWEDRAFVNLSFGVDTGSSDITQSRSFTVYDETGTLESTATSGSFGIFDITVGARVWRNVGVGFAFHTGGGGEASISGSVPHPLFFDRPRTFTTEVDDAQRDEHATHLQFGYMLPINDKFDVYVFGGPSFYHVSQELVTDITFTEAQGPPFTDITVLPAIQRVGKSAVGYNVGADGTYFVYTTDQFRVGVGGMLRFTGATADLEFNGQSVETKLGGVQIAFGGRLRF